MQPRPVVWASVYPESQDDFANLKLALGRLKLSDSAFSFEEESSGALGRGFRCGFLGMLHLEIITERLKREFNLNLVITTPSITYYVDLKGGKKETVYSPHLFPDDGMIVNVREPWVNIKIIVPTSYLTNLMPLLFDHEAEIGDTENWGDNRSALNLKMPLREMMRNFFDDLKSATSGYTSISYELGEIRDADVTRMDVIIANEVVPAFTRVISRKRAETEAEQAVEKLHAIFPRQQFEMKVQAVALGRIIASRTIKAYRKDVLMHGSKVVGGGDISRKKKLLEKQKRGKKKMKENAKMSIPHDVFLKMMRSGEE
jgi:GTP-binding protein LepA